MCATDLGRRAHPHGGSIGTEHGVRVQKRQQRREVAVARCREEGLDHRTTA